MDLDKQALEIENLTEVLQQLQKEVLTLKNDVEKLKLTSLIEKMHQFIEKTDDQLKNIKHNMEEQRKEILQLKQASNPAGQKRRPSDYRRLQNMLQNVNQKNPLPNQRRLSNKVQPATVQVTGIQTNRQQSKK